MTYTFAFGVTAITGGRADSVFAISENLQTEPRISAASLQVSVSGVGRALLKLTGFCANLVWTKVLRIRGYINRVGSRKGFVINARYHALRVVKGVNIILMNTRRVTEKFARPASAQGVAVTAA